MVNQDTIEQRCGDESSEKTGEEEGSTQDARSHIGIPVWSLLGKTISRTARVKGEG